MPNSKYGLYQIKIDRHAKEQSYNLNFYCKTDDANLCANASCVLYAIAIARFQSAENSKSSMFFDIKRQKTKLPVEIA